MLPTSKLILGTVQFGLAYGINNKSGKPSFETVTAILDHARNAGITRLDTAEAYGDAIAIIGKYHALRNNRFGVISKFHVKDGYSVTGSVSGSLETMDIDAFDAYLFHSYNDFIKNRAVLSELLRLKESGAIRNIGVSVYTNDEFATVLKEPQIGLVQLPYNLLDNAAQRSSLMQKARYQGMVVHTRSAYLQGLFFSDPAVLPAKLSPLAPWLTRIKNICAEAGIPVGALALQYALDNKYSDGVLIGVDTVDQLKENIAFLNTAVDSSIMDLVSGFHVKEQALLNPGNWS